MSGAGLQCRAKLPRVRELGRNATQTQVLNTIREPEMADDARFTKDLAWLDSRWPAEDSEASASTDGGDID